MSSRPANVLVDTSDKLNEAVRCLKLHTLLSIDCEGVNLGKDGELCLMQVATSDKVYLFDFVVLGKEIVNPGLKEILEDDNVTKLFYDCREDCSALKHLYGVNVKGMEDMQLLNTLHMKLNRRRWQCVSGLQKCMDYHLKGSGFSALAKEKMHRALDADNTLWRKRPLTQEFISYAATDVFYLERLRNKLYTSLAHKVPRDTLTEAVKYASTRYADFMGENSGYVRDSPYYRTARLPERIIPELVKRDGTWKYVPFSSTTGSLCTSCHWRTDTRSSGQCLRCYYIDHPTEFNISQAPVARIRHFRNFDYDD